MNNRDEISDQANRLSGSDDSLLNKEVLTQFEEMEPKFSISFCWCCLVSYRYTDSSYLLVGEDVDEVVKREAASL